MSRLDQLQYPQLRIHGPLTAFFPGAEFMKPVANGDWQMGQSKQFLEHLQSNQHPLSTVEMETIKAYLPRSFALYYTQRHLEEATGAIPTHYLLYYATRTFYLLTIFTVQKVLKGVEGEVRSGRPGVECPFLLLRIVLELCVSINGYRDISAGTADVCVWKIHCCIIAVKVRSATLG